MIRIAYVFQTDRKQAGDVRVVQRVVDDLACAAAPVPILMSYQLRSATPEQL